MLKTAQSNDASASKRPRVSDPLVVASVEKAFKLLSVFGKGQDKLTLSQIAEISGFDLSSAQRCTHTLVTLGYLQKEQETRRFSLTLKNLDLASNFLSGHRLINLAMPYLMHLSKETEETVNLTLLDGEEIVFVSRFLSRHMLNTDVVIGTRMPAYCTAPGIAILSRLDEKVAEACMMASRPRAITEHTTWRLPDLMEKIRISKKQGFATQFEEFYHGDASIAAPVMDSKGYPLAAVNVAVSLSRYNRDDIVSRFAPLVVAAAHAISKA